MNALGIISFEDDTALIDGLGEFRPVPAISFLGRYRIVDFILSNMTNSGINNVQVYCKEKPRNLFDHLGNGTHYNVNSKRGKLRILYGEKPFSSPLYNTDVANYVLNMQYIEADPNPYVIVAPSYFVYSYDFTEAFKQHLDSKADITVLYKTTDEAKTSFLGCDALTMNKNRRVTRVEKNRGNKKSRTISMEAYIMEKKLFIELVNRAASVSSLFWLKDMIADVLKEYKVYGYGVRAYVACVNSLSEYFRINMDLRNRDVLNSLFINDWPIYTQTNDSCPTRFTETAHATGSIIANGCLIEGDVEGSIIGRNVTIREGAVVKDCIIMTDAYIGKDAKLDHVIVDKYAIVHHVKKLEGSDEAPVYVKRRDRI